MANESPASASPLSDGENKEDQQGEEVIDASGDDVETKEAEEEDLEEGELLDDGEVDEIVKQEESETVEPVGPPVIPSLLDMKISPPRNGLLYRKRGRWSRKPIGRRRHVPVDDYDDDDDDDDDDDAEDDSDGQQLKMKKLKKRKNGGKAFKTRIKYIDHDRTEVDSDDADSNIGWPGFGKSQRQAGNKKWSQSRSPDSSGHVRSKQSQYDSPLGAYDSPYTSPPGPYDSPESDTDDKEESTSEKVVTRNDKSANVTAVDSSDQMSSKQSLKRKVASTDTEMLSDATCQSHHNQPKQGKLSQSVASVDGSDHGTQVKRRRLVDTPWDERPACKFFLEGKCGKGADCLFNHNCARPKKPYLCRYYKSGHCTKLKDCIYHHETWPCVQFHRNGSCSDGDNCRYSHEELTDETRPLLEKAEKDEADDVTADQQLQPKKKALLGDYPQPELLPSLTSSDKDRRKIPSLFDLQFTSQASLSSAPSTTSSTTSATSVAGLRPPVPRVFPPRNNQPGILGAGPAFPPHLAVGFMRMHVMPPMAFPLADMQRFPFDPTMMSLPPTDTANAAVLPTNNAAIAPGFSSDNLSAANASCQVDTTKSLMMPPSITHLPPTCNTSCVVPQAVVPSVTAANVTESTASWQPQPQPSVVAGVDLSQLPPLQRQLFLRIHQQNEAAVNPLPSTSHNSVPSQTTTAVVQPPADAVNAVGVASVTVSQMSCASNEQTNPVVDMLKGLVQQPPPTAFPATRLPIAPMFDINQVLSAINQTVPTAAAAASATGASTSDVGGWQQECRQSESQLEVNGLRTEIEYIAQPIDCSGTVIPAYMDINDTQWDEDPRVQHWRREIQLGHVPRRETPRTVHCSVSASSSVAQQTPPRDPRLKADSQPPPSTVTQLQLQQHNIQQMVHQLMQSSTLASASAQATTSASLTAINSGVNMSHNPSSVYSQMSQHADSSVSLPLVTGAVSSQQDNSLSVLPTTLAADSRDAVVSSDGPVLPSTANDVQEKVTGSVAASSNDKPPSPNKAEQISADQKGSNLAGEPRKIDYHNDPRFKRRKTTSLQGKHSSSTKSAVPGAGANPPTCESVRLETNRDTLQFQSPLAAAENTRLSPATSGYNRPPNKRYQELLQQGSQQPSRDPRRKPVSTTSDDLQLKKADALSSVLQSMVYPGIVSHDQLSSTSLAKGSLKDMFKTIDPTASPFC